MVTDGFLLILVLLVLGAFIYCCISKKREEAARTHERLDTAEEEQTTDSRGNKYNLNRSGMSNDVTNSVESRKRVQGKPIRSDFGEDELTDSKNGGSGGFKMQRWHESGDKQT